VAALDDPNRRFDQLANSSGIMLSRALGLQANISLSCSLLATLSGMIHGVRERGGGVLAIPLNDGACKSGRYSS
jgi:hypothetical protein